MFPVRLKSLVAALSVVLLIATSCADDEEAMAPVSGGDELSAEVEVAEMAPSPGDLVDVAVSAGSLLYTSPSPRDGLLERMPA